MKSFKVLAAAALALLASACGKNTLIEGNLHEGEGKEVIVKLLDVNRFQVLDTLKAGADGSFRYALDIAEGKPEFVYLFYGDRQIASLLLEKGDKVKVFTDTFTPWAMSEFAPLRRSTAWGKAAQNRRTSSNRCWAI